MSKIQKTFTVNGNRYTGKQIAKLFNDKNMTNGDDYIVKLGGRLGKKRFFANYRNYRLGETLAPVCNKNDATCIALMPDDGTYNYSIWLWL